MSTGLSRTHAPVHVGTKDGQVVADWGASGEMARWDEQMDRHLAHERVRLRVIAGVLLAIGVLVAVEHAFNDNAGRSLLPLGLDDLLVGYPSALMVGVYAGGVWNRARCLAQRSSHRAGAGGDGN